MDGGKFSENYFENFGKHLFNTAISQAKGSGSDDMMSMSKGVIKTIHFIDNEEGFGGGKFASVYHAYEDLVGTSENTGYDKLMHFSFSAEKTFSFGSKIGAGLGYAKEFFKDEIPSWLGNDKGWDNIDIKANKSGIQFGTQMRNQYSKFLGEFMKKNPPSTEKLPVK